MDGHLCVRWNQHVTEVVTEHLAVTGPLKRRLGPMSAWFFRQLHADSDCRDFVSSRLVGQVDIQETSSG